MVRKCIMPVCMVLCFISGMFASMAHADVRFYGDVVMMSTPSGVVFMGEVINDTGGSVSFVRVDITAKNLSGEVIDEPFAYVDGLRDPKYSIDCFLTPGLCVPFRIRGDVAAGEVASFEAMVTYETSSQTYPDLNDVTLADDINILDNGSGTVFWGEVSNNSPNHIYNVELVLAIRAEDGNLIDVAYGEIDGEDYYVTESFYSDTLIQPGEKSPFSIESSVDISSIADCYPVITYRIGDEGRYEHWGEDLVTLTGDITLDNVSGKPRFSGEIQNGTEHHLYYAGITFVLRDSEEKIIGIDFSYVDGTLIYLTETVMLDSHITPGGTAPFEVHSSVDFGDVASYEYFITYRHTETVVYVEENEPLAFTLGQNYPNPFNPTTTIAFTLSERSEVRLDVFNVSGQMVAQLINSHFAAGHHAVTWNASRLPSGVYFYMLTANGQQGQRSMTLIK